MDRRLIGGVQAASVYILHVFLHISCLSSVIHRVKIRSVFQGGVMASDSEPENFFGSTPQTPCEIVILTPLTHLENIKKHQKIKKIHFHYQIWLTVYSIW